MFGVLLAIGLLVFCGGAFVAVVFTARRWRRRRTVAYERDPDAIGLPPAACGYLLRGMDHVSPDDLSATVLDLVDIGVLDLLVEAPDRPGDWRPAVEVGGRPDWRYALAGAGESPRELWPFEVTFLELLFDEVAEGDGPVPFDAVRRYSGEDPDRFYARLETFTHELRETTELLGGRQDDEGVLWDFRTLNILVVFTVACGFVGAGTTGNPLYFLAGAVMALVMGRFVWSAWRPAAATQRVCDRCAAVRDYLRDVGRMREKPAASLVLWRRYLVYAAAFGLADEVGRELDLAVPGLVGLAQVDLPTWRVVHRLAHGISRARSAPAGGGS